MFVETSATTSTSTRAPAETIAVVAPGVPAESSDLRREVNASVLHAAAAGSTWDQLAHVPGARSRLITSALSS